MAERIESPAKIQHPLAISREIGNRHAEGAFLGNLGSAYNDLGEPRKAIEFLEQALVISREVGNRHSEGLLLFNYALVLDKLGKRVQAVKCAEEALNILEPIRHPLSAAVRANLAMWKRRTKK